MNSSMATGPDVLVSTLEEIEAIDKQIDEAEAVAKGLKQRRGTLEKIAIEAMAAARMEKGVPAGARTWRVQWEHRMSVNKDRVDALRDILAAEGRLEDMLDVSTAKVKSLLIEKATARKANPKESYVTGTPYEGVVSEFVEPVLRHLTVPSRAAAASEGAF